MYSDIEESKQRDALLSNDCDELNSVVAALADLMAVAKQMGALDD